MDNTLALWIFGVLVSVEGFLTIQLFNLKGEVATVLGQNSVIIKNLGGKFVISPHTPILDEMLKKWITTSDLTKEELELLLTELKAANYTENGKQEVSNLLQIQVSQELRKFRTRRESKWRSILKCLKQA